MHVLGTHGRRCSCYWLLAHMRRARPCCMPDAHTHQASAGRGRRRRRTRRRRRRGAVARALADQELQLVRRHGGRLLTSDDPIGDVAL